MANFFDQFDEQDKQQRAAERNYFDQFSKQDHSEHQTKHYSGLAKRAGVEGVIEGVGGIPALAADAAYNAGTFVRNRFVDEANKGEYGMPVSRRLSDLATSAADAMDLARPETAAERIALAAGKGGISALTGGGVMKLGAMGAQALGAARTAETLGLLGSGLGQQATAGTVSAGTTQGLTEAGVDPRLATALGIAAGPTSVALGRRMLTPAPSNLTPEQQRLAAIFENEVGPLSAGQSTGSKWMQVAEDQVSKLPFGDALVQNPRAGQRDAFTRAALAHAGVDAEAATPEVVNQAFHDIGKRIGNITENHTVRFDPQYAQDVHALAAEYVPHLEDSQRRSLKSFIDRIHDKGGVLDGADYQRIRSQIGTRIRSMNGPNVSQEYRSALIDLQSALDDAMSRSIVRVAPDDAAALQQARQQYANMSVISRAVAGSSDGVLTPKALQSALTQSIGKRAFSQGRGDLNDLSRAGTQFLTTPPDSGTASRWALPAYVGQIMAGGTAAGPKGAIGAAALPFVAQMGVNSPLAQMYLRNQLMAGPTNNPGNIAAGILGAQ